MKSFVCCNCMQPVKDPYQQYEKRMEYRRVGGLSRKGAVLLGHICLPCVDKELAEYRPDETSIQESLL